MKVLIGINNLNFISQLSYTSHWRLAYNLGRACEVHKIDFGLANPRRMSIDRMRNECAKIALEGEFDYLWFLDDDVLVEPDSFPRLKSRDKDIIAGVTHIRGYPFYPMIFNFTDPAYKSNSYVYDYKIKADEIGLLKCDAVGFSCCLIKTSLLKKIQPPFFATGAGMTEDVFFCLRAKEQLGDAFECFVDTHVHTGHILGEDFIEPSSVELWKKFEEERFPGLKEEHEKTKGRVDMNAEYITKSMGVIL